MIRDPIGLPALIIWNVTGIEEVVKAVKKSESGVNITGESCSDVFSHWERFLQDVLTATTGATGFIHLAAARAYREGVYGSKVTSEVASVSTSAWP